jgi:hypothetical protein
MVQAIIMVAMMTGITSYLVYQNYEFFLAIVSNSQMITVGGFQISVPAILNSVVAELILLTAAAYTASNKLSIKMTAWSIMVSMIVGLGFFMHSSIDNDLTGNNDQVQSLKQQRQDTINTKISYEAERDGLDALKWKTRRQAIQNKIDVERALIATLDAKIAQAKDMPSNNLRSIVVYNTILRIMAIVINAILAHSLICLICRK